MARHYYPTGPTGVPLQANMFAHTGGSVPLLYPDSRAMSHITTSHDD